MKKCCLYVLSLIACFCWTVHLSAKDVFLFVYFVDNGQDGVYLAMSDDGVHFRRANSGRPIMTPPQWPSQNLTRDPSIVYQDGKFRMVWTSHWNGEVFGYSESENLLDWSSSQMIAPLANVKSEEDKPINIWAPEIHWDPFGNEYFVIFSATTPREMNDGDGSDNSGCNQSQYDNRMFITFTKNGSCFSDGKLFFDQGFSTIDGVLRWDKKGNRWVMVVKNSRNADLKDRPGRNLCLTFVSKNLKDPAFTPVSAPVAGTHSSIYSHPGLNESMAEGQCLLYHQNKWWLYWDEPAGSGMQLAVSDDLLHWKHIENASFPKHEGDPRRFKAHHGTIIVVPEEAVKEVTDY